MEMPKDLLSQPIHIQEYINHLLKESNNNIVLDNVIETETDLKDVIVLLDIAHGAIEPIQDWGNGRVENYTSLTNKICGKVNELRFKYKFYSR